MLRKNETFSIKKGKKTRRDIKVYLLSLLDLLKDVCAATGEIALPAEKKRNDAKKAFERNLLNSHMQ